MRDEDFENIDSGSPLILIQAGIYPANCLGYVPWEYGPEWGERLIVTWKVLRSITCENAVELPGYYTVKRNAAGRFRASDRHSYRRDWIRANDGKHPLRRDCLPFHVFMKQRLLVEVETVMRDSKNRPLHTSSQYSKVSRVVRPFRDTDQFKTFPLQLSEIS